MTIDDPEIAAALATFPAALARLRSACAAGTVPPLSRAETAAMRRVQHWLAPHERPDLPPENDERAPQAPSEP